MHNNYSTQLYKKISALSEISDDGLDKLFGAIVVKEMKKGAYLLSEGQICRHMYFVEKGYLRTFVNKDGIEINTSFAFETAFTSDLKSLSTDNPSGVIIQAGENTTLYMFEKKALLALYKVSPEIESFGRKLLSQMLIAQQGHADIFKTCTPAERYQYLMAHEPEMLKRVSLSHIASYLGMARETLSRIRKLK